MALPSKAEIAEWLQRSPWSRRRTVGVGLFLLAVPTFFTVIPGWTTWSGWWRGGVLLVWVVLAAVAIAAQTRRDEKITSLAEDTDTQRRHLRSASAYFILEQLLRTGVSGMPDKYEFTVYVRDRDILRPVFPALQLRPGEPDLRIFGIGDGATGSAWKDDRTFVVTGEKVHTSRHGLSDAQQEFFKDYLTVAATPITFMGGRIGVLTALGKEDDRYFDEDRPGRMLLERLAQIVGVVLKLIQPAPQPDS